MKYLVWYDVYPRSEKLSVPRPLMEPVMWFSYDSVEKAQEHVMKLTERAFRDGRRIAITISPEE